MTSETEYLMADGQPNEDPLCPDGHGFLVICDYIDYGEGVGYCPECGYEENVKLEFG